MFCRQIAVFTGNISVVDTSVVSRRIDISPVHSNERSGRPGYWKAKWGVKATCCSTERDYSVSVNLQNVAQTI